MPIENGPAVLNRQTSVNVSFVRPELFAVLEQYFLIRDAVAGETAVKKAGDIYLPRPNAADTSKENKARFIAYLKRAVFYNVTRRTLTGLIGQVFMRDPKIEFPTVMQPIIDDANGAGVSLIQLTKKALSLTLAYSRSGLFVDYPRTEKLDGDGQVVQGVTKAEQESGEIRPTMSVYSPLDIINWRVRERGAKEILSLVVLAETYAYSDDGFEMKNARQYRVLRLDETQTYVQDIYRENMATEYAPLNEYKMLLSGRQYNTGGFTLFQTIQPKDAKGQPLKEIPFMFIGSESNDSNIDDPNMYDLASLNIAHYRNSADYEESCYIVGQPTPVLMGLTEQWFKEVLKETINFGSRGGIPLPVGASAELLQAAESTMLKEAMEGKERQMIALGAKLTQDNEVQRTAFEAKVEATAEGSVLSTTAKNTALAFGWALSFAAEWQGIADSAVSFELNTDFDISRMTPEEQSQVIKNWQAGALTWEEMRNALRNTGIVTEDDAVAKEAIAKEQEAQLAIETDSQIAIKEAAPPQAPPPKGK